MPCYSNMNDEERENTMEDMTASSSGYASGKEKVAFVRLGKVPIANVTVARVLTDVFHEYQIEEIDLLQLIKKDRLFVALNTLVMIKEYGLKLLLRHRRRWNCFFTTTYSFKYVKRLMAQIHRTNHYAFSFQMQSLFDASKKGIPHFVYTDHTYLANLYYPHYDHRKLPTKAWIKLERSVYQNAALTFVRSTHVEKSVVNHYGCARDSVECVYAGNNAADSDEVNLKKRNKNILFVGMDWERKGGPELLRAFRDVLGTHPDAELTIVGCNPLIDLPQCNVVGQVSVDEMARFYDEATVFCLPTKVEPFGIVFVEALHHGLPIIATNIGAVPDMVQASNNGYLVPPGDVDALSNRLIHLLSQPDLCRRFGEYSRAIAEDRYNWHRVGALFRRHIEEKTGHRARKEEVLASADTAMVIGA